MILFLLTCCTSPGLTEELQYIQLFLSGFQGASSYGHACVAIIFSGCATLTALFTLPLLALTMLSLLEKTWAFRVPFSVYRSLRVHPDQNPRTQWMQDSLRNKNAQSQEECRTSLPCSLLTLFEVLISLGVSLMRRNGEER